MNRFQLNRKKEVGEALFIEELCIHLFSSSSSSSSIKTNLICIDDLLGNLTVIVQ